MCGLVGIGDFSKRGMSATEFNMFLDLFFADVVRGRHGSGVVKIDVKGQADWRKMEGNPFDLFAAEGVGEWFGDMKKDYRFYLGHNRFATRGTTEKHHAHPFTQGHITLMHNGTLFQTTTTPKFKDFDVDSEAMAYSISQIGIQETINKTYGAYCFVWWDDKEKTLNLLRNKERPLFIGVDKQWNRIAFASEFGMLAWCANRNQIKMEILELPEEVLYTYDLKSEIPKKTPMRKVFNFPAYNYKGDTFVGSRPDKFYEENEYLKLGGVWQYLKKGSKEYKQAKAQEQREKEETKREAKQGKLKLVTNARVSKSDKEKGALRDIDNLFGYHVGDRFTFVLRDYVEVENDKVLLEGFNASFRDLTVYMYISSKGLTLNTLLETMKVRGTIKAMRFNLENTKLSDAKHQMWLADPEPVFEALEAKEASLMVDGVTGEVIPDFVDPFADDADAAII